MAYIGSTPTSQNFTSGTDYFSGTGSQTAFTLTRTVNSVNDIEVVINNVVQQPSTAYTLSGNTVTFTSAPSAGTNNIYVRYLATNMQSFTVPANSIDKSKLSSDLQAGFQGRNKIINGSMVVNQRGWSGTITTNGTYTLDRFNTITSVGSKFSVAQSSTAPAGFTNSLLATSLSAYSVGSTEIFGLQQVIEGYNIADLGWGTAAAKTVTLSFQVYSSLTGTFGGAIQNYASDRIYPFSYTVSSANTWTTVSITIAGDTTGTWSTTNGGGLAVIWSLGSGSTRSGTAGVWGSTYYTSVTGATSVVGTSGATFYITGVQLEEGTTATSFEREIYSVTLQKCQRYYLNYGQCGLVAYSSQGVVATTSYPVTMRASPTVSISYGGVANTVYTIQTGGTSVITPSIFGTAQGITNFYYLSGSWATGAGTGLSTNIVASAEL